MNTASPPGVIRRALRIPDAWATARGELAVAYYTAAFDLGIDALKQAVGIDEAYRRAARRSTVALEAHIVFLAAVPAGAEILIDSRIVDRDAKRLHVAQRMQYGELLAATRESMTIGFDLEARRSCAFEPAVFARIEALYAAQAALPVHVGTAELLGV